MCCLIPQYMIQRKVTLYLIQGKSKTSLSSPSIICPIQVHCGVHLVCESTGPKPINQVFSNTHATDTVTCLTRWQKLCEGTKGLSRKVWVRFANLQLLEKRHICREKVNTGLTKIYLAIFALSERLPTSATLLKKGK